MPTDEGVQRMYGEAEIARAQGAVAKDFAEAANLNADTYKKMVHPTKAYRDSWMA